MSEWRDDDLRDVFAELRAPASTASYASRVARDATSDGPVRGTRRWPAVLASVTAGAVILIGAVVVVGLRGPRSTSGTPSASGVQAAPSARLSPAMAYDSTAGLTVLYGGRQATGACCDTDTWTWDGSSWHDVGSGGPKLADPVMTDDPADGGVLMLGGVSGAPVPLCGRATGSATVTPAGIKSGGAPAVPYCVAPALGLVDVQTWLWHGGTWQRIAASGPPANAVIGTVPGTGQVIAVSAAVSTCPEVVACPATIPVDTTWSIETWVWGNATWTLTRTPVTDGPQGLAAVSVLGTPALVPLAHGSLGLVSMGSVCSVSELCVTVPNCPIGADCVEFPLWRWAGAGWGVDPNPSDVPAHPVGARVAFDGTHAAVIGAGSAWTFNGTTWTQVTAPFLPGNHGDAGFAADRNGNYVLFGGVGPHGIGNDTWLLTPSGWRLVAGAPATPAASPPCPTQVICASVVPVTVPAVTPAARSASVPTS